MSSVNETQLLEQIRSGDEAAWKHLIELYEGRLLAFAYSRLNNTALAEDVVQETLVGFLTSLPNYDESQTRLESFLFRIAAYKITDQLRRQGRRPVTSLKEEGATLPGRQRRASSLVRSREGADQRKDWLRDVLREQIAGWLDDGNYERLQCCELLFVRGWPNNQVAEALQLTDQQVANHKQALLKKLKSH